MRARAGVRFAIIAAAGLLGLFTAHAADYLIVVRDRTARIALLTRTGHAYLGRALEMAAVAAVIALIACVALAFKHPDEGWSPRARLRGVAALALIQSGAFVAVEAAERIAVHAIGQRLISVTIVGIALQVVAATLAVAVLSLVERAVNAVSRALRWRPREVGSERPRPVPRASHVLRSIYTRRLPARAPPFRFVSR